MFAKRVPSRGWTALVYAAGCACVAVAVFEPFGRITVLRVVVLLALVAMPVAVGRCLGMRRAVTGMATVSPLLRNGPPPAAPERLPSSGHGLAVMRERVRTLGGTLTAGPDGDGGWLPAAALPPRAAG